MATYSVNWSAPLHSTSGSVAVGHCLVVDSSGYHFVGTTANRTTYGRCIGIASSAGDAATPVVSLIEAGPVPASITGLAVGTVSWVRVSATGTLERVTPGAGDDIIGKAHADGSVQLHPGVWDSANYAGGAVSAPTGTGMVTVTAGAYDAAATVLGTGMPAWFTTPSSANLIAALTDETGTGACVFGTTPTFKTSFILRNPADTFGYTFTPAAIAANRIINLPLMTGTDTITLDAFATTLTNKTIAGASNTLTVRIANDVTGLGSNVAAFLATPSSANFAAAVTGETGSGGVVFDTSPTISGPTISGSPVFSAVTCSATGNARARGYSDIANVQTTDATVTSLFTWTILDEAATLTTAEVCADLSTGATTAAYVVRCRYKRDGGTVTAGTPEATFTDEEAGFAACALTLDNSTSTGRVRVTGIAATTIDWGGIISRLEVSHA